MSWFKVDDKLWGHPKWLATPIRSRGLWVTAGSWCADQEMDGTVPRHVLPILGATVRDASALVAAGLWRATDTGWCFHGWAEFQPTRAQKDSEREEARERMRLLRARKAEKRDGDVRPNIDEQDAMFGDGSGNVRSTPSRPVPTRPETSPNGEVVSPRRSPETRLPDGWAPTDGHATRARELGLDLGRELEKFRDHAAANDRRARDWNAAFRTWLTKAAEYAARDAARPGRPGRPAPRDRHADNLAVVRSIAIRDGVIPPDDMLQIGAP